MKEIARQAAQAGHVGTQRRMKNPLMIQGVGHVYNTCEWEVSQPVALPTCTAEGEALGSQLFNLMVPQHLYNGEVMVRGM